MAKSKKTVKKAKRESPAKVKNLRAVDDGWGEVHYVGWKNVSSPDGMTERIVKLNILAGTEVCFWDPGDNEYKQAKIEDVPSDVVGKMRCEFAEVEAIFPKNKKAAKLKGNDAVGLSHNSQTFAYTVGVTVEPTEDFAGPDAGECASGIHFFATRDEAIAYNS